MTTAPELRRLVEAVREARERRDDGTSSAAALRFLTMRAAAERALCDALLSTPALLDAYEAVRALGAARAASQLAETDPDSFIQTERELRVAWLHVCDVSDRTAKGGE